MSYHALSIVYLQSMQQRSSGADSVIATYILTHRSELPGMTIAALAEKTNTSYATVCRFFKKLGVSGFRELKTILNDERAVMSSDIPEALAYGPEEKTISFSQINKQIRDFSLSIIESCCATTTPQLAQKVCSLFEAAESLFFVGFGTSAITAQYAYTRFFRLKTACDISNDPLIAKMKASLLKKGDVLFAISSSGRTKTIIEITRLAQANGAIVISLCDFVHTPLGMLSDLSLYTTVRESNKYVDSTLPLLQGQITIINLLFAAAYYSDQHHSALNLWQTIEAISSDRILTPS